MCGNCTIFGSKMVTISARNINIYKICKLHKAIFNFRILQHFLTTFCNFTKFNKFFTGIYFFLPRSKISQHASCLLAFLFLKCKIPFVAMFCAHVYEASHIL